MVRTSTPSPARVVPKDWPLFPALRVTGCHLGADMPVSAAFVGRLAVYLRQRCGGGPSVRGGRHSAIQFSKIAPGPPGPILCGIPCRILRLSLPLTPTLIIQYILYIIEINIDSLYDFFYIFQ